MKIDDYGRIVLNSNEAFNALYSGQLKDFNDIYISDEKTVEQVNQAILSNADHIAQLKRYEILDIDLKQFDANLQQQWFMPEDYYPNLVEMLYGMCETEEQTDRVSTELNLYIQHGMMDLLFYLKYLVDTMRENNIVWGVGRGSSVASYVLYLIGIHKIDSIKYDLDIKEFLK